MVHSDDTVGLNKGLKGKTATAHLRVTQSRVSVKDGPRRVAGGTGEKACGRARRSKNRGQDDRRDFSGTF